MKVSELRGAALDWAVAQLEGYVYDHFDTEDMVYRDEDGCWYQPSEDWAQGGPIIERERISLSYENGDWYAVLPGKPTTYFSYDPLVSAMRCYVVSKLGDEIEIPEILRGNQEAA